MKLLKIILLLLVTTGLFGIFDDYEPSPRARALGGAFYSVSNDANAIFYNPAGLATTDDNLVIGSTKVMGNDFQVLSTVAFSMKLPKKFGTLGIGLQAMDVEFMDITLESEKIYALSHSFTLLKDVHSEIYFGYVANMYHLSIDSFGNQPTFGVNIGALAILHQRTRLGFAVTNLNNPKVGVDNSHDLPQKLAVGISYIPYQNLTTSLELKKGFADVTEIHAGIEMEVFKAMTLRFGARNNPNSFSGGVGFHVYDIILDYGFNTHIAGDTHHFGLGYKF
jgi:hypothetical protein